VSATAIVALDVSSLPDALQLVAELGGACRFYKVGNELFTAEGPDVVRRLRAEGADVFLDLKFHDIPNTVAGGVRNAARLGAKLVTVHATGGEVMVRAAVDAAGGACGVLAVTVLTSMSPDAVGAAWGRQHVDIASEVLRLAELAVRSGAQGIVCSGIEAPRVRAEFGESLAVLVPGVRGLGGPTQDQARVVTPRQAVEAGARYVVVGRMVTGAPDRRAAMEAVARELG
jgi:orotidine-5'-phosphate decarboxylase